MSKNPTDSSLGRIAYLTSEYPAVSHTFILREVEALRRQGRDVITCSIRRTSSEHHRGPAEQAAARSTFYVISAAASPKTLLTSLIEAASRPGRLFAALRLALSTRPPGLRALVYQMIYLTEAIVLARHLQSEGVRHLHNHFGNASCTVAMLASEISGIPYSYTMHGPSIFFEPRRWRIDEKIARATFVSCISHFCRSQGMIFADPAHWQKLRIVHCGIEPDRYARPADRRTGKTLLFVGRLAAVKGVRVLIDAFADISRADPEVRLVLVGDGPERQALEEFARDRGCFEAIRFAGYLSQEEVAAELSRVDLFVLPSFAEGVPVVLMEALASEVPVVATRIAGIGELVTPGETGELVAPGDVHGLRQAIKRLLDQPDLRREMGRRGRQKVVSDFNIDLEAEWLGQLIDDTEASHGLRPV